MSNASVVFHLLSVIIHANAFNVFNNTFIYLFIWHW